MARPFTVHELKEELQFWIKSPTDPSLRKLLRRTIQTLTAFSDLVGVPEDQLGTPELRPSQAERSKNGEES